MCQQSRQNVLVSKTVDTGEKPWWTKGIMHAKGQTAKNECNPLGNI